MSMDATRRFVENAVIIFRALFRWFTPSSYIATKLVTPVEALIVFGLLARFAGGATTVAFMVVGNSIVQVGIGGLAAANTVSEERSQATLSLLLASPASRLANFLQRGLVHILDALVSVRMALAFAALVFHVHLSRADRPALAGAILVAALSSVCLGLLLGALALAYANFFLVHNLIWLLILLVAGVNVPVASLPAWLQPVSAALPFTRSIHAARLALEGASLASVAPALLAETALAGLYVALGYAMLKTLELVARQRGTLELT